MLADFSRVQQPSLFVTILYFCTSLGHEAVMIFFVLSGFLVGGLTLKQWRSTGVDLRSYFVQRISRIYTVLIPALCIGFVLDLCGAHFFNGSHIYSNPDAYETNSIKLDIAAHLTSFAFIANVFMLEGSGGSAPVLGSNGPLWSLAYEWWYYCIFAATAGGCLLTSKKQACTCLVYVAVLIVLLPPPLLVWMVLWLLGILAFTYAESDLPRPPVSVSFLLFAGAVMFSRLNTHNLSNSNAEVTAYISFAYDFSIGITYALLTVSFYRTKIVLPFSRIHKHLASFSYSLYLFHFPLLVFAASIGHDLLGIDFLQQPDVTHVTIYCILVIIVSVYGYVCAMFTENNTHLVKAHLSRVCYCNRSSSVTIATPHSRLTLARMLYPISGVRGYHALTLSLV